MAGLRPGKKRGKSWGEGAAAISLRFGRAPFFFFCKCLFFYRVSGNGFFLGFFLLGFGIVLLFHILRSVFIVLESLRV